MENAEQWVRSFYQSDCGCSLDDICGRQFWRKFLKGCIYQEELDDAFGISPFWGLLFCGKDGIGKSTLALTFLGELENNGYQLIYLTAEELLKDQREAVHRAEQLKIECIKWGKAAVCLENAGALQEEFAVAEQLAEDISFLRQNNCPCIWVLVTEREDDIPQVLQRQLYPCRLELPTQDERTEYFSLMMSSIIGEQGSFQCRQMAELTDGFDFSQLGQTAAFYKTLLKQSLMEQYENDWLAVLRVAENGEIPMRKDLFGKIVEQIREETAEQGTQPDLSESMQSMQGILAQIYLQSQRSGTVAGASGADSSLYAESNFGAMNGENGNCYENPGDISSAYGTQEDDISGNWLDKELDDLDPDTLKS